MAHVHQVEVKRQLGPADIAAVSALLEASSQHDGHPAFGEHQWLDLVHGGRSRLAEGASGFAGIMAFAGVSGRAPDGARPIAYAQVSHDGQSWAIEYTVDPAWRPSPEMAADLVGAALGVVGAEGGGRVHLWRSHPDTESDAVAAAVGLRAGRDLLQLRRPLPTGEPWSIAVRPFVPGRDEEEWLEVNNRAFGWHPEQGGWDLATLKGREELGWFDPGGFLLHEENGRLAGFCWTKVHDDPPVPLGEIYVIAVDPDFGGRGLGRELTLAGLDHLAGKGLTVGMLYVDATNTGARALYDKLGFTLDHIDRAYVGDVPGGQWPGAQ